MPRSSRPLSAVAITFILVAGVRAQDAATDPIALLRGSAESVAASPGFSTTLVCSINIVMGEQEKSDQQVFEVECAAPNRFAVTMVKPTPEFWVRSDGQQTMTYVEPLGRYAVTNQQSGLSAFAASELAGMLGNEFGRMAFGLLDTESTEGVIESVTESEYLGTESIEEQELHHCRYNSGGTKWEAWFTTGDAPRLWRFAPDLGELIKDSPAAKRFDNFSLQITFTLRDVDQQAEIAADSFEIAAPQGAQQVSIGRLFSPPPHELLGKKAPVFESESLAGEPIDLGELLGKKVVILDFWATWCGPCVAALPKITKVAGEYADKGVAFYAVNQGEDAETVTAFLTGQGLEVPVAMDPEGEAGQMFLVEGLPTTVIIGKDGRVQVVHVGLSQQLEESLHEELDALLAGRDLASEALGESGDKPPAEQSASGDE